MTSARTYAASLWRRTRRAVDVALHPRVPQWADLPPRGDVSAFRTFQDIAVVPCASRFKVINNFDGGPVWPEGHDDLHHRREGRFYHFGAVVPDQPLRQIRQRCSWGGYACPHFGHFVSEHAVRVLMSARQHPKEPMLFITRPGLADDVIRPSVAPVLDWYGVTRAQRMVVRQPLQVAELRVAPAAEQLGHGSPSVDYLDLLAENQTRNRLQPIRSRVLYVCRTGMLKRRSGGHAGENYLVALLRQAGAHILDPAKAPLRQQLAAYAGAETIVFAEGSAMHGRQLLGRIEQRIVVLNRRRKKRTAEGALAPRSAALHYAEVAGRSAFATAADGKSRRNKAISFYDVERLHDSFQAIGIDLASRWDNADYLAAREADVRLWLQLTLSGHHSLNPEKSLADIGAVFQHEGVTSPLPSAATIARLRV